MLFAAALCGGISPLAQAQAPASCIAVRSVVLQGPNGEALLAELGFLRQSVNNTLKTESCLNEAVLRLVLQNSNNALVSRGYVTSRVSIPEQNIASGTLRLVVTPGRIEKVVIEGGQLGSAGLLPLKVGRLLKVKDLDQSVEILTRLRSVKAETKIEPGSRAGYSVVRILTSKVGSGLSGHVGAQAQPYQSFTGVNYSASLNVDNPLRRADQLRFSVNVSPSVFSGGTGSSGFSAAYSMPFNTALLTFGGGYSLSNQARAGYTDILNYGNKGWNVYADAFWTPYRAGGKRTDLNVNLKYADTSASLNGTDIAVQRARSVALDTNVRYSNQKEKLRWGVQLGNVFEYRYNPIREGLNTNSDVLYGNYDLAYTFGRGYEWQSGADFHWGALNPQAQPYTISGANLRGAGAVQLSSDHGATLRNAFFVPVVQRRDHLARAYAAADYGFVTGSNVADLPGQHLLGAALGVQGQYRKFGYNLALGYPVVQPATLPKGVNFAFSVRYSF